MNSVTRYTAIISLGLIILFGMQFTGNARRMLPPEEKIPFDLDWFFRKGNEFSENISDVLSERYANKQTPGIMYISCADSRVPAVWKFNTVFKISTAGNNIVPVMGSMEYGRDVLNIPITIIVGHSNCGAIKAAMAGTQGLPPNIKKEIDTLVVDPNKTVNENIIENVHRQVSIAMSIGKKDDIERAVIGVIYDHSNDFKKGHDAWIIVNVNGQKDTEEIKNSPLLKRFEPVVLN